MLRDFRDFILRGNVVDLAVAVVIEPDFGELAFTINGSRFRYGAFLNAVISFFSIAAVIFFVVVRPLKLLEERRGARRGRGPHAEPAALPRVPDRDPERGHAVLGLYGAGPPAV